MRGPIEKRTMLGALCAGLLALALGAPSAQAAAGDPLWLFVPTPSPHPAPGEKPAPPPTGYFNGPCGLAVDGSGRFYVSDYYHDAIDVFGGDTTYKAPSEGQQGEYKGQLANVDDLDGPCALALNAAGDLYVNDLHRGVIAYEPFGSFGSGSVFPLPAEDTAHHLPTGVAVDPTTGQVYVDDRTYVSAHDSSGDPVEEAGQPVRIGVGSLGDGYGLARSQYPGTLGRLYVPDAASGTVKVYDPAVDKDNPVATIEAPGGGPFTSLRDSAIAVDRITGEVYVTDDLQPADTERPQAIVYVYSHANTYEGHLKYDVVDALPAGLAVDNSAHVGTQGPTQGRVYVTTGNTNEAGVYAYPPGSAIMAPPLPPLGSGLTVPGTALNATTAAAAGDAASSQGSLGATAAASTIIQEEGLRLSVNGRLSPKKLPRMGAAPISVSVGWNIGTPDGSPPPRLKTLGIEINRHGLFDYEGLPTCPIAKIQPATTQRALSNCRSALVGQGTFSAEIALKGQEGESYETTGKLLVFNGENKGKPVLFGQIYSAQPFATSFVIVFKVTQIAKGSYGTALTATLPKALRSWGNLNGIEMELSRRYGYKGKQHSYLSAGCPAPKGTGLASFKLARTSFAFNGGKQLSSTVVGECKVRG